jgi:RNA polymerase sigma factor (sigma-70 family)
MPEAHVNNSVCPTVFVVDDDGVTRALLIQLVQKLGYHFKGYPSAEAFLHDFDPDLPGCMILDIQMEGMNGLELQRKLVDRQIALPVIMLSAHGNVHSAVQAMKQHAFDFVEKPFDRRRLSQVLIKAVARDLEQRHQAERQRLVADRLPLLSPREKQVMDLVVAGLANKQIARELDLSEKTVEVHRGNVMRKMQAQSVAELVRMALINEPVPPR